MVKIRLRRMGSTHSPFYRVVVSDSRRTPASSAIEELGYYNPRNEPAVIKIDRERVDYWVSNGAQLSPSVAKLLKHDNTDEAAAAAAAPKAEAKQAAEPKAAEAKAEEAKAEEPKAEEPKAEEPKAEEPKAEEPKAEEPKAEEPKAEEAETE